MRTKRKYQISQRYEVVDIGGEKVLMPVFDDLSDYDLFVQMEHYKEREDFEYCAALKAEADLRGISLIPKKTKA